MYINTLAEFRQHKKQVLFYANVNSEDVPMNCKIFPLLVLMSD